MLLISSSMGRHGSLPTTSLPLNAYYTVEKLPGQPWVARVLMLPGSKSYLRFSPLSNQSLLCYFAVISINLDPDSFSIGLKAGNQG